MSRRLACNGIFVFTTSLTLGLLATSPALAKENKFNAMPYDELTAYHGSKPGDAKAVKVLSERSMQRGKYAAAKQAWEDVIASNNAKQHNTARLALAGIYMKLQDFGKAKKLAQDVLDSNPSKKEKKAAKKLMKKVGEKTKPHDFSGSVKFMMAADSNAASASSKGAKAGKTADDEDEDEDDEDYEDEDEPDDDVLDDVLDDMDLDEDDLDDEGFDEDDGDFFDQDEEGDLDGDGFIDDEDGDGTVDPDLEDAAADAGADAGADPAALIDQTFQTVQRAAKRAVKAPKALRDQRYGVGFGAKYRYVLSDQGDVWQAAFNYSGNDNHDVEKLDRYTFAFNTGPVINFPDLRLRLSPSLTYLELIKTGNHLMSSYVTTIKLDYLFNPDLTLSVKYGHEFREFEGKGAPEVDIDGLKFGASYKLTKYDTFGISYAPKIENSTKDTSDKDQWGLGLSYNRALPWDMFAAAAMNYKRVELDKAKKPQADDVVDYNITLGKKLPYDTFIAATFIDMDRDSNLALKSKNNQSFLLTTGWKF